MVKLSIYLNRRVFVMGMYFRPSNGMLSELIRIVSIRRFIGLHNIYFHDKLRTFPYKFPKYLLEEFPGDSKTSSNQP